MCPSPTARLLDARPRPRTADRSSTAGRSGAAGRGGARSLAATLPTLLGVVASILIPASAASAASAATATTGASPASVASASTPVAASEGEGDVDDFDYASWTSRYELALDGEGRATAHVTETLVADFPEIDQNKGIVRGLPERYEGAGLDLRILSVTDGDGREIPYETDSDDGVLYVLTGDDDFVHGRTVYVIEYTMRDLMIRGEESGNDEFYWDLLPLDSSQDIREFRADIALSPELTDALTGDVACYRGAQGSTDTCALERTGSAEAGAGATFTVRSGERAAGDGVTVAIGFDGSTVTQPPSRSADPVSDIGPAVAAGGSLAVGIGTLGAIVGFRRRRRRATGLIIAQYDVPADIPPLLAAPLIPAAEHPVPAQIVHLAVRGALRIEESPGEKKGRPVLRLLDRSAAATDLDARTLSALFGKSRTERRLPKADEKFSAGMSKLLARGEKEAESRGWVTKARSRAAGVFGWVALAVLAVAVVLLVRAIVLDRELLPLAVIATIFTGIVTAFTLVLAFAPQDVLTPEGARWHEYLMGVREFIRVAEADRIRMLQSYTGAERRTVGAVDTVVLYERLLPYAMLLGEEKSWAKVLEQTYASAGASPSWTDAGHGPGFGLWMTSFAHSAQSSASYTSPSSGSSSGAGGSTGGGFSGGGGGGGFSGGR